MPSVIYQTNRERLDGWRFFWAKRVSGFDEHLHCAPCLTGTWLGKHVNLWMPVNKPVPLPLADGELLYVCGVSMKYVWENNFHLAARAKAGSTFELPAFNGDRIIVEGAEALVFNDTAAREHYPDKHEAFLTCRNFQFGAHCMHNGIAFSPRRRRRKVMASLF